jgi:hypothetical protein
MCRRSPAIRFIRQSEPCRESHLTYATKLNVGDGCMECCKRCRTVGISIVSRFLPKYSNKRRGEVTTVARICPFPQATVIHPHWTKAPSGFNTTYMISLFELMYSRLCCLPVLTLVASVHEYMYQSSTFVGLAAGQSHFFAKFSLNENKSQTSLRSPAQEMGTPYLRLPRIGRTINKVVSCELDVD